MDYEPLQRWVTFDALSETMEEFLEKWKPSVTPSDHVEWLFVSNRKVDLKKSAVIVDTIGLRAAWNALLFEKGSLVTKQDLESLALIHNVRTGKWLIYVSNEQVDQDWGCIATALMKGQLGSEAKVSTFSISKSQKRKRGVGKGKQKALLEAKGEAKGEVEAVKACEHVICVYSADFSDVTDVFKLRASLKALGFAKKLMYKPDAYTAVGVYKENQWNISPVAYCG